MGNTENATVVKALLADIVERRLDSSGRKATALSAELDKTHPDAAGSLRDGLDDMFTVRRLGIGGTLARVLVCTNVIESMISITRTTRRNDKRLRMTRTTCAGAGVQPASSKPRRRSGGSEATCSCPPRRRPRSSRRYCHTSMRD